MPGDPGRGVLDGFRALVAERAFDPGALDYLVHGATIAINTVIQRNGAALGLLVTAGFGDVLEIQRLRLASPVNFTATRPLPLIPRYRVGEVTERILADGTVDTTLDRDELLREATRLVEREGAEALVVSFVNAYRTPAHEAEARKVLAERFPGLHVTCSHEVWPQIREYERTMVAILSAYVRPRVDRYLGQLERELGGIGVRVPLYITKSNGGVTTARDARQATAETMLSGPASGVIGATYVCVRAGYRDLITFDMGGTSADIALVRDGQPVYSTGETVGDFPIVMPVVGVSSIGAGGGSIAWLDPVGVLKVGPRSAGADPGPACYGHGGTEPALSDAFLLCGFLNPDNFVGGRLRLHPDKAAAGHAAARRGARPRRGRDRRGGDRGGHRQHVRGLLERARPARARPARLRPGRVRRRRPRRGVLPGRGVPHPARHRAAVPGHALRPGRHDGRRQERLREDDSPEALRDARASCSPPSARSCPRARRAGSREEAPAVSESTIAHTADLRYVGQAFQIEVPIDPAWLEEPGTDRLRAAFHDRHERLYAHADRAADVELIDLRATITGATPKPALRAVPTGSGPATPAGRRPIHYRKQRHDAAVYHRRDLMAGQHLDGPAVVEQEDTTTLVPAGFRASVDAFGNLVIERA